MRLLVSNSRNLILGLFILLSLAFRLWVSQTNWMHYDENYYLNIAQNFMLRGELTPYMWRLGDANIIAGSGSGYGVLLLIAWLKFVQGSLYLGRLLMVAMGMASAVLMYHVGVRWWGSISAGIVTFLFALASTSPFYTLTLRMDAIGVLAYCILLLLYLRAIQPNTSPWLSFVVGVFGVIILEFHIMGVIYLLAIGLTYLVYFVKDTLSIHRLTLKHPGIYFAAGASLVGILYFLIHVLPDPKAYFIISQTCFECDEGILATEIKRFLRLMVYRPIELLMFFAVIGVCLRRRGKQDQRYLILVGSWIVAQAFVGPPPYEHYASHFWPLIALGVGGLTVPITETPIEQQRFQENQRTYIGMLIAFVILVSNLVMYQVGKPPYLLAYLLNEMPAIKYIQENIPQDSVIMSRVPRFYPLRNYPNFLTYRDGDQYGVALRGETMTEFWQREQPVAVWVDEKDVLQDLELLDYLHNNDFIQIQSDLWVSENNHGNQP